ncbi:MAG: D-alanyl-D-alanine carboxypeptidase/D-alanyl-D-alanine-endopeptidase [Kofleriaceae bacterium]|nr:D-alanyl-D-alanine carboxypeptidase/D-alanyl-D-alanine-endopeptidase [Kofleriaceae bacterium]
MKRALAALVAMLLAAMPATSVAGSRTRTATPTRSTKAKSTKTTAPKKATAKSLAVKATKAAAVKPGKGAARVTYGKELRTAREVLGRREEPLTLEEETAKQIEKLLRGPLRNGVTGLFVADARTGEPLFAVNADDALNPASNVKMISTATALELLGPKFKYTTRVLGPQPDASGTIKGDVFLLGTWDPTLSIADMDGLAEQIAAKGVKTLAGDVLVGSDATRDGIFRSMIPVEIRAGEPGQPPTATTPAGFDLVQVAITAKTEKKARKRHRLKFATETITNADGHKRIKLTISGTIGKGGQTMHPLYTKERTAVASHALRAALRAHGVAVTGDMRVVELGDFVGDSVGPGKGALPAELARHESAELQQIVSKVNKWSINWLADRVIMTAAALSKRTSPSMDVAIDAMYAWLTRHSQLGKDDVTIDTGSGLSYRTRITPHEIVKVVRAAAGFSDGAADATTTKAWHDSLSIAGTDGTLRSRFRPTDMRGHIRGKTGSLSTVIALSGLLEVDPTRPLAFSIITNTQRPLKKGYVRKAHEQLVALLCKYITATAKPMSMPAGTPVQLGTPKAEPPPALDTIPSVPDEIAEPQPDPELDVEAAGKAGAAAAKIPTEPTAPHDEEDDGE